MSDTTPATTTQKAKVAKKPTKPAEHPTYAEMTKAALLAFNEKGGSSKIKIVKYLRANYKVAENADVHVKLALKRMVISGALVQVKGTGASGSFKLNKNDLKEATKPKKPVTKKPAAKKPASKKPTSKKPTAKKPASKKTPVKKSPAKKPTSTKPAKSPAKKPAAKKTAKTAATKKPAKKTAKKPATKKPATKKPAAKKTKA